jgi:hypothetical protein
MLPKSTLSESRDRDGAGDVARFEDLGALLQEPFCLDPCNPLCGCPGCESVGMSDAVSGPVALTFGGRFVGSLSASGY